MTILAILAEAPIFASMPALCPLCQKPATPQHAPFCSERCRQVDLNRWFTGAYAVPAVELDDVDDEGMESPPEREE
jgi:hypothetical protein